MQQSNQSPNLSVAIVCYEMAAQIRTTLHSLLPPYQRDVATSDYEVVLIDNGSAEMLATETRECSPNLRYIYIPPNEAKPNPASALNQAARLGRAPLLCLMIDGARMLTPGVLAWGQRLMQFGPRALVEVRGWHLGPKFQPESVIEGYDHEEEKRLLQSIGWPDNGYRLWDIAAPSAQIRRGYAGPTVESNCIFLSRELFEKLGGFDERYTAPGGGWVNLDFFARAVAAADPVITLLGEGTFHQTHRGAATGLSEPQLKKMAGIWRAENEALDRTAKIGSPYKFILAGHMPPECQRWLLNHLSE